jgi:hypothetical protein
MQYYHTMRLRTELPLASDQYNNDVRQLNCFLLYCMCTYKAKIARTVVTRVVNIVCYSNAKNMKLTECGWRRYRQMYGRLAGLIINNYWP